MMFRQVFIYFVYSLPYIVSFAQLTSLIDLQAYKVGHTYALIILYDKCKINPLRRHEFWAGRFLGGMWGAFTIVPLDYRHLRLTDP